MICRDTPTHGWVHGWFGGWVVQWVNGWGQVITKYWINLDLIDTIHFCLKIYDLWWHPTHGWINGWAHVKSLKSNKSWPNQDNSIVDIFDILWTFYLNHLSPLWGYFSSGLGKLLILQHIWSYIIISISKEIWPTLRLSYIFVYIKS